MPSADTQIRSAAAAALLGLPTTGSRIFIGRTRPNPADHDPLLLVYGREVTSQIDEQGEPPAYLHNMTLFVEGRVSRAAASASDDVARALEEQLDAIKLEVVTALLAPQALGLPVESILLRRSTLSAQAPGERHEGDVRIEFGVQFRTPENDFTTFV